MSTTPGGDEALKDPMYRLAQQTVGTLLLLLSSERFIAESANSIKLFVCKCITELI